MELSTVDLDNFDDDLPCLARESCVQDLLRDAPADCLYCRLEDLSDGDDD
jgi:hypothetical protein